MNAETRTPKLFSIGHSNHSMERFLELLELHGIEAVADVRSSPYSRYSPQFSRPSLEEALKQQGISYVFLGDELGARRDEPECYSGGLVVYDRVPQTEAFQKGLTRLIDGASRMTVAMMCAEKDPLTCHRTILIARYLKSLNSIVHHILADGGIETQLETEERLLVEHDLHEQNLFFTREQRLLEAYQKRAARIAYEKPAPHA